MTEHLSSLRLVLSFLKGLSAWQHMLSPATINIEHIYICFLLDLVVQLKKKDEVSLSFPQAIQAWPNMPTFSLILFLAFPKTLSVHALSQAIRLDRKLPLFT
jgi:hypothetical protein